MDAQTILLSGGNSASIDAPDFDRQLSCQFSDGFVWFGRICDLAWKSLVKDHTTYAVNLVCDGTRELRLHRLVMCASGRQIIDHRDGNGLDCRRQNLRITDHHGNAWNRAIALGHSSRFKGVAIHRQTGKYEGYIRKDRKKIHLGLFNDEESAGRAYDAKALELFGEFARLNFPLTTT